MAVALKEDYQKALDKQKQEVREFVMAGLEQIKAGKIPNMFGTEIKNKGEC